MIESDRDAVVGGDTRFESFFAEWREPIRRALALAIGDVATATEAVDEAMTRAMARWEEIREYERPQGWVYRVGLNWARGQYRKRRFEILTQLDPDRAVGGELPDVSVLEAVGRLSWKLRSIVVARYYLEWSTAEVAEAFGIPEGTVKSRSSRALDRLAKDLGGTS